MQEREREGRGIEAVVSRAAGEVQFVTMQVSPFCPTEGHGNPLQYSCLENPHGQRSLAGYSPWDWKELDMTEQLPTENQLT